MPKYKTMITAQDWKLKLLQAKKRYAYKVRLHFRDSRNVPRFKP